MKELTIEEKAKAYDEAILRAKEWFNVEEPDSYTCIVESIFPELKESEDEKIRKALIRAFKSFNTIKVWNGIERTDILAWLEKQKPVEQKPTDKVEPKFHEDDWVVLSTSDGEKVVQINSIADFKSSEPMYITSEGRWFGNETKAHLWTIKDAKDGDVLVCPKYANDIIPNIFIFKNIATKDNDAFCYCSFLKTFMTGGYVANADPINTDFYPATKEQRDTLMKAIADAGYTFDFEKKELRKIEQKQKWSEEDEYMIKNICNAFEKDSSQYIWLKSLKDRVQPKQKWSEDDEYVIERLFCLLNNEQENYPQLSCDFQEIQEYKDWLKSLKDRYT